MCNKIRLGDFNIHMENVSFSLTKDFASCLDSFGLQKHIDFLCTPKVTDWTLFAALE